MTGKSILLKFFDCHSLVFRVPMSWVSGSGNEDLRVESLGFRVTYYGLYYFEV